MNHGLIGNYIVENYSCPHCNARKTKECKTPKGLEYFPHVQRRLKLATEERRVLVNKLNSQGMSETEQV
jgi:hypothetical protein